MTARASSLHSYTFHDLLQLTTTLFYFQLANFCCCGFMLSQLAMKTSSTKWQFFVTDWSLVRLSQLRKNVINNKHYSRHHTTCTIDMEYKSTLLIQGWYWLLCEIRDANPHCAVGGYRIEKEKNNIGTHNVFCTLKGSLLTNRNLQFTYSDFQFAVGDETFETKSVPLSQTLPLSPRPQSVVQHHVPSAEDDARYMYAAWDQKFKRYICLFNPSFGFNRFLCEQCGVCLGTVRSCVCMWVLTYIFCVL